MVAFNNEIASADKIGLHLSEIGRLQNNAGSLLQLLALFFGICIFYFNDVVYPANQHRMAYASLLAVNSLFLVLTCYFYLRCLTLSVGWSSEYRHPKTGFHFLSTLSEEEIENTLFKIVGSFRGGTYCFFLSFFGTFALISLVAFMELDLLPK